MEYYTTQTPTELAEEARFWEGACQDEQTDDFDWHFNPTFPITNLAHTPEGWEEWMKEEIKMWAEEGQPDRYDDMLQNQPIREAVVLHIGPDNKGHIWDGNHRVGASAILKRSTIPAIVGTRKPNP